MLNLVILLASMFSRTWQLRAIYKLDKHKRIAEIRSLNPIANAILKLVYALLTFVVADIVLLSIWSLVDPYHAEFIVVSDADLIGSWKCSSLYLGAWLGLQILLLSGMIIFGIMVIYQTWTFSNQNVVLETRWVLMALYNVVLVVVSMTPLFTLSSLDDETLSIVMGVMIDFSALGIIFAVLLPRVVKNLLYGSSSGPKGSGGTTNQNPISSTHGNKEPTHDTATDKPDPGLQPARSDESLHGFDHVMEALTSHPTIALEPTPCIPEINESNEHNESNVELSALVTPSNKSRGITPILDQSSHGFECDENQQRFDGRGMNRLEGPENESDGLTVEDPLQGSPIFNPFT